MKNKKAKLSNLKFEYNRFWSSSGYLPIVSIISIVLKRPTIDDIILIVNKFGLNKVKFIYKKLKKEGLNIEIEEFIEFVIESIERGQNGTY